MALQIRRFQEERDRWEIDREELECQANSATAERDELLEDAKSLRDEVEQARQDAEGAKAEYKRKIKDIEEGIKAREAVIEHKESEWKKELESVKEIFRQKTEVETVATLLRQEVLELRAHVNSVGGSKDVLESAHRANQQESTELNKLNERMSQQLNQLTSELNREKDTNSSLVSNFLRTAMPAVANLRNSCGLGPVRFGGDPGEKMELIADSLCDIQLEVENKMRLNRGRQALDELASARGPRNSLQSTSTTTGGGGSLGGTLNPGRDLRDPLGGTLNPARDLSSRGPFSNRGEYIPDGQLSARDEYYARALQAGHPTYDRTQERRQAPTRVCASAFACAPPSNPDSGRGFNINSLDFDDFRNNSYTESRRVTNNKITFNNSLSSFSERAQPSSRSRTAAGADIMSRPFFTQSTEDQSLFYARKMYDDRPVWERTWHGVPSANATPRR